MRDNPALPGGAPRSLRRKAWSLARAILAGRARYPLSACGQGDEARAWRARWADLVEDMAGPLGHHWDNCAVSPSLPHAYRYCLSSLLAGLDERDIAAAYEAALRDCHARATDLSASTGHRRQWSPASTVARAEKLLSQRAPAIWLEPLPASA